MPGGNTLVGYGSACSPAPSCCLEGLCSIRFSLQILWVILLERKCTKVLLLSNIAFWISAILKISVYTRDISRCIDLAALHLAQRGKGFFCHVSEACSCIAVFPWQWNLEGDIL